jgi:GT2 family glycosyltransferase
MFFKREVFLEVGGFDTHFFLYCEEEDLSKRVIDSGYNVMFIPDAKIYHKGGGSCSSNYALIKEYYISYTYLILKHFNILTASLLYFLVITKLFRRSFTKKNGVKLFVQSLKGFIEKDSMRYNQ